MRAVLSAAVALLWLVTGVSAYGQILLTETFNYGDGALCSDSAYLNTTSPYYPLVANDVSGGLWVNGSTSTNDDPLLVQPGALSYPGYILSGLGKKVWCPNLTSNTSNNRASRLFPAVTGRVYYAAMVRLPNISDLSASTSSGGEYLFGVYSSASFATAAGRGLVTFRLSDSTGKYQIGIRATSTATAGWVNKQLDTASTYLVAVCYDRTTATAQIWINPPLTGGTEPAPEATSVIGSADANADIGRFGIYQRGSKPHAYVGGVRVGTSWVAVSNTASLPLTETFNYPLGALCDVSATLNTTSPFYPVPSNDASGGIWMNGSTSKNDDPLLVQSGPLTYTAYALSGIGNKVYCPNMVGNTSNNRASRAFTAQTGKVYYSILVNLPTLADLSSSTSSGGEYLVGLYTNASFATASGRGLVTFRLSGTSGKYQVGIRASSTATAGWVAKDLDTNTTQLVVVSYSLSATKADVWVNPAIPSLEPVADATSSLGATETNTDIGRFGIYQRGTKPHAYVGGVYVSTAWPLTGPQSVNESPLFGPNSFKLIGNYPNPFNPSTTIAFTVDRTAPTSLRVFNLLGQHVQTLFEGEALSGRMYEVTFGEMNLPSGLYFARLESAGKSLVHKMILTR
jgi:hypothetical protein